MIKAVFTRSRGLFRGAVVSGHAGYAEEGFDIVCASVSSAVQLVCNGVTETLGAPADVIAAGDRVSLCIRDGAPKEAYPFIEALHLHLDILSRQYAGYIEITVVEE